MSGCLNEATLIGNLTRDPEVRRTQDGRPIVNLSLATNETWRDKNSGERKEKAEYHRIVIFNENLCKVAEQYLKKGAKIFVRGALQTRKWQDQAGVEKYSTEIVIQGFNGTLTMLDGANGSVRAENAPTDEEPRRERPKTAGSGQGTFSKTLDDDAIPFVMEWR